MCVCVCLCMHMCTCLAHSFINADHFQCKDTCYLIPIHNVWREYATLIEFSLCVCVCVCVCVREREREKEMGGWCAIEYT